MGWPRISDGLRVAQPILPCYYLATLLPIRIQQPVDARGLQTEPRRQNRHPRLVRGGELIRQCLNFCSRVRRWAV